MPYLLQVRLAEEDIGSRVVVRWSRPTASGAAEVADVLGILEAFGDGSIAVRKSSGELVIIPQDRALAGKTVPPGPRRGRRRADPDADTPVREKS
ncbi:MAG TPA: hypothetical protein VFV41_19625 [Streptosporangiaceae bacterium]|nr:hypothetical protein [Streptosporangiaceae bacterium]